MTQASKLKPISINTDYLQFYQEYFCTDVSVQNNTVMVFLNLDTMVDFELDVIKSLFKYRININLTTSLSADIHGIHGDNIRHDLFNKVDKIRSIVLDKLSECPWMSVMLTAFHEVEDSVNFYHSTILYQSKYTRGQERLFLLIDGKYVNGDDIVINLSNVLFTYNNQDNASETKEQLTLVRQSTMVDPYYINGYIQPSAQKPINETSSIQINSTSTETSGPVITLKEKIVKANEAYAQAYAKIEVKKALGKRVSKLDLQKLGELLSLCTNN